MAEEVRNPAARSAQATKETSDLIEGSVAKAATGSEISQKIDEALNEVVFSVTKVSHLVGKISAASIEQVEGVSQVTTDLEQIYQITQQNSAHAEESASAAEELASQAELLQQIVSSLRITKGSFSGSTINQFAFDTGQCGDNGNGINGKRVSGSSESWRDMKALPQVVSEEFGSKKYVSIGRC